MSRFWQINTKAGNYYSSVIYNNHYESNPVHTNLSRGADKSLTGF
ncbi:hypothetical protein M23134_05344 [Microscilla marina ATCC 23134]|uniref:Uncharacterized protein n=1 Tax=Microscilla marina ATCC 23134 TaxID=313606 RepID=A1ZHK4_MICM2|nr:hypothetical protein M23134_05344 [Microscilla marina ATCC 23134]